MLKLYCHHRKVWYNVLKTRIPYVRASNIRNRKLFRRAHKAPRNGSRYSSYIHQLRTGSVPLYFLSSQSICSTLPLFVGRNRLYVDPLRCCNSGIQFILPSITIAIRKRQHDGIQYPIECGNEWTQLHEKGRTDTTITILLLLLFEAG